jgi:hypothetical protein
LRLLFGIVTLFFVYLIVYRRIIEPFMEGYHNKQKIYNDPNLSDALKNKSASRHPTEIEGNAKQEILDAEFKEIDSSN